MRNLRSVDNDLLRVPSSRTSYYDNSFTISSAKLWNDLPLDIRDISVLNTFKNTLKAHLLKDWLGNRLQIICIFVFVFRLLHHSVFHYFARSLEK